MSKKFFSALVAFSVGFFLSSCNFATPENHFDKAVLNVNPDRGDCALLAHPSASPADESVEHRIERKGDRVRDFHREEVSFARSGTDSIR